MEALDVGLLCYPRRKISVVSKDRSAHRKSSLFSTGTGREPEPDAGWSSHVREGGERSLSRSSGAREAWRSLLEFLAERQKLMNLSRTIFLQRRVFSVDISGRYILGVNAPRTRGKNALSFVSLSATHEQGVSWTTVSIGLAFTAWAK